MSSCGNRTRELLPEFVRGHLDPGMMIEVADHLEVCGSCSFEVSVLRELAASPLPEPPPWFWSSLPGKVIAEAEDRRRLRTRAHNPAWAGGLAAAALAALLFILPGVFLLQQGEFDGFVAAGSTGSYFLALEEELLSVSGTALLDLDEPLLREIGDFSEELMAAGSSLMNAYGYETMDQEAILILEGLVEEMTPEEVRKRVMS